MRRAHGFQTVLREPADPRELWRASPVEFAFRYPYSQGWRPLVWCTVALLLSPLVLPFLAFVGYLHRVSRSAVYGGDRVPPTSGALRLVYHGFRSMVAFAVYVGLGAAAAVAVLRYQGAVPANPVGLERPALLRLAAVAGVWIYGLPAAHTAFAVTDSVVFTYLSLRIPRLVLSLTYFRQWLVQFAVLFVLSLAGAVMALSVVGVLFWPALVSLVLSSYWGRAYYDAVNQGRQPPPPM